MFYFSDAWISLSHICCYVGVTELSAGVVDKNENDRGFKKVIIYKKEEVIYKKKKTTLKADDGPW